MLFSGFTLLEIKMCFFCTRIVCSKSNTNGEYYQISLYRLLRINTFFLVLVKCNDKGRRGFIISNACQSVK